MLSCTSAPRLPSVIERAAETHSSQKRPGALISNITRSSTANAAAFGPVDINPTMGAGAPSYTSGVQTWKGAEATLNPRPTNMSATATYARGGTVADASALVIASILVEPVAPNIIATP